jgi:hypothetical protein
MITIITATTMVITTTITIIEIAAVIPPLHGAGCEAPGWGHARKGRNDASDLEGFERLGREQVFGLEAALRQALLVMVAQEGFEHRAVLVEAV